MTAAAELVELGFRPTVLEKDSEYVGGISRTVRYKGFRFDIGGHRFFSKSPEITEWWHKRLPSDFIKVKRVSRIFYRGKFFDYPLKAFNALSNLGVGTSILCVLSYGWARLFPIKPERSFADWVTNRFGALLFRIFFKTYSEKVWGMPCTEISADWAAQRIKDLSLSRAIFNALFPKDGDSGEVVKTLIDEFYYPRLGPGMMWEKTKDDLIKSGAQVKFGESVVSFRRDEARVISVVSKTNSGSQERTAEAFIVSMPLQETVAAFDPPLDETAQAAAKRLQYRDFLTVAVMVKKTDLFHDQWIYIHEPRVKVGRIQNFNNWSAHLAPDPTVTCLGLEYFCFKGDATWNTTDAELLELAKRELKELGLVDPADVFDGTVVRMPHTYPVYYPGYQDDLAAIRKSLEKLTNFQVAGRAGMHKYNNQDHAMMTGMLAARNFAGQSFDLWKVNADAEYLEEERTDDRSGRLVPKRLENP